LRRLEWAPSLALRTRELPADAFGHRKRSKYRAQAPTREEMGKDMPPAGDDFLSQREVDAVVKYLFAMRIVLTFGAMAPGNANPIKKYIAHLR
jgi:hypothetical protein